MKVVSIIGARPQFIKYNPVSKELRKCHQDVLVHTGQHYDYEMSKVFFDQLNIPKPKYNLGVGSDSHGVQTGKMLIKIEKVLLDEKPDLVLVFGDTNSTIAGALASVKLTIPLGHVEAGLRSYDRFMPEEINRVLTDHSSNFLFAPTKLAKENLSKEGITEGVFITGDVMFDALLENIKIAEKSDILNKFKIKSKEYFLATVHRPSNTDIAKNLSIILESLSEIDKKIIFPIHPRTVNFIKKHGLEKKIKENIFLTKPLGYLDFLCIEKNALKIITDSGGIQKEAYMLQIPCITLRESTEWAETIKSGWNILVGNNKNEIINAAIMFNPSLHNKKYKSFYGRGHASKKIIEVLDRFEEDI